MKQSVAILLAMSLIIQSLFVYAWCFEDVSIGGVLPFVIVMMCTLFAFCAGSMFSSSFELHPTSLPDVKNA